MTQEYIENIRQRAQDLKGKHKIDTDDPSLYVKHFKRDIFFIDFEDDIDNRVISWLRYIVSNVHVLSLYIL